MAPGGTASVIGHGGVGLRSSCHVSCVYRRVESFLDVEFLAPTFPPVTREVCRESVRFCQARGPLLPASGRLARSARPCTPRPSRCFAKRIIEQRTLAFQGTIAFRFHMMWWTALFLFPSAVPTVVFATFFSIFPVFLAWHCALSLLSIDATGKSLPRWRLALAHKAPRGDFSSTFSLVLSGGDVL